MAAERVSPAAEPVEDLELQAVYLDWLRAYRVIDPRVTPSAALRDAFLWAYEAGREEVADAGRP